MKRPICAVTGGGRVAHQHAHATDRITSGFHPASGVRGGKPKDLWFGIFRKENEQRFLGNPQGLLSAVTGRLRGGAIQMLDAPCQEIISNLVF
jgi:hypothetical protein